MNGGPKLAATTKGMGGRRGGPDLNARSITTFRCPNGLFNFCCVVVWRNTELFQFPLPGRSKVLPNVGHLVQLLTMGRRCGACHFPTLGGMAQIILVFSQVC